MFIFLNPQNSSQVRDKGWATELRWSGREISTTGQTLSMIASIDYDRFIEKLVLWFQFRRELVAFVNN
ncbi:hypothetical protein GBA52_026033 [Prunus armeniaca]|nr:hypothetical protein GBA52_026033 [Prunus armeniaca]